MPPSNDLSADPNTAVPHDDTPADGDARARAMQAADLLDQQLEQNYDDETERDNAKAVMYDLMGIDPVTRLPVDYKVEPEPDPEPGKTADSPDPSKQAGTGDDPPPDADPNADELARLRTEIAERDSRLAELEAKSQADASTDDLRREIETRLAGDRAALDALRVKDDANVQSAIDEYGEDVGKRMRTIVDDAHALREDNWKTRVDEEVERARAATETQLTAQARLDQDIAAVPDLKTWHDQAKGGDLSMWKIAEGVDSRLSKDPEWLGRPQSERFAEVAQRVNKMVGAVAAPESAPGKTDPPPADPSKKTDKQIEAEIARHKSGKPAALPAPSSLSDLAGGGGAIEGDLLSRLGEMDATEIAGLNLSAEAVDKIMLEREAAGLQH